MDLEPQKFFIGVIDFFSILLPGALLTYLLKNSAGPRWFGARFYNLSGTEGWVIFLFSSYLVGHFVFLLGSSLLDDRAYDPIRKGTFAEQVRRLANSGELSPKWARWLAGRFLRENTDHAVRRATEENCGARPATVRSCTSCPVRWANRGRRPCRYSGAQSGRRRCCRGRPG